MQKLSWKYFRIHGDFQQTHWVCVKVNTVPNTAFKSASFCLLENDSK
jgi:hypothetical protein